MFFQMESLFFGKLRKKSLKNKKIFLRSLHGLLIGVYCSVSSEGMEDKGERLCNKKSPSYTSHNQLEPRIPQEIKGCIYPAQAAKHNKISDFKENQPSQCNKRTRTTSVSQYNQPHPPAKKQKKASQDTQVLSYDEQDRDRQIRILTTQSKFTEGDIWVELQKRDKSDTDTVQTLA